MSEITPDSFRLFLDYLPAWKSEWRDLRIRLGSRFQDEWRTRRSWSLDERTPFEDVRVLDAKPSTRIVNEGLANLKRALPVFEGAQVLDTWGGLIDVTPDAVPVIGPVSTIPGFYVASGFSGHGFGIGPGAGKLAADLIAGDASMVEREPYRLERFKRAKVSLGRVGAMG